MQMELIAKEIKTGVKYATSRYSGGIIGSIVLSIDASTLA